MDTEIVETDVVLPPLDGGPDATIEGNEIPNAPSVSFNGRIRYQWPVSGTLAAAIQTDFTYVDEHFLEPNNREYLSEDGYFLANARVSLLPQDGRGRCPRGSRTSATRNTARPRRTSRCRSVFRRSSWACR